MIDGNRWQDWFEDGERLIWEGAPMPGIRHFARNLLFTGFGLPFLAAGLVCLWVGLGMLAELTFSRIGVGIFLVCFSLPFIGVGAAMVFGGWYSDYYAHKFVRYALSDRRGYIATRWWSRNLEVLDIHPDHPVEVSDGRNVYFHTTIGVDSDGDRTTDKKGFENIADGQEVYRLIRAIQAGETVEPL